MPGGRPSAEPGDGRASGAAQRRRYLGYNVQYFAAIEPRQRLAPHAHIAFRGAISRSNLRQVIAATYHQVWWPSTASVRCENDELPDWHPASGNYIDPATGEILPTWDQALDGIDPADEPLHVTGTGPNSTPRACSQGQRTRPGVSATSPST